jgi:hypothetical protein
MHGFVTSEYMVGSAIPYNSRIRPSVEGSMCLYPFPHYLGLSSEVLVALTDESLPRYEISMFLRVSTRISLRLGEDPLRQTLYSLSNSKAGPS